MTEKKVYHVTITCESDNSEEEKTLTKEEIIDSIGEDGFNDLVNDGAFDTGNNYYWHNEDF